MIFSELKEHVWGAVIQQIRNYESDDFVANFATVLHQHQQNKNEEISYARCDMVLTNEKTSFG